MNGEGQGSDGVKMAAEVSKKRVVLMCGYLPGALPQRSPILSPVVVQIPANVCGSWNDVCSGGCGFAMAVSDSGKLITWGSTDDLGQSYVTSGKHGETPEPFLLPTEGSIVKAAAGWAHCVAITSNAILFRYLIKIREIIFICWKTHFTKSNNIFEVSPQSQHSRPSGGTLAGLDSKGSVEESKKRRRITSAKQAAESSPSGDETPSASPCLVTLYPGVRVVSVAAGGRHTLALSDIGQVWGWGYGGEGQLGLGSRIRRVSSPHPVPCINNLSSQKDRSAALSHGSMSSEGHGFRIPGSYVRGIACGGRHSAVITDAGALLTFGWGLYGQVSYHYHKPNGTLNVPCILVTSLN
ncbi:hypothetical protein SLEP1_g5785 [Rubroshorea leprosula]|uniref:Ultraviolet-B receptor UVR8 n=1 Tax=Rubroshorea leprosula TaxID=152421 RepID=A0AAV5I137_9ROSI|nr:hypothetical protein SLEP1_g5785 [Rubroshorea leprosula]